MNSFKFIPLLPILLTLNACSWVELTAEGEKVRVLGEDEVARCTFKGKSTVSVTEKIVGARRHDKSIQEELVIIARNGARNLDGDTIVAASPESEGKQVFKVYRCVPK